MTLPNIICMRKGHVPLDTGTSIRWDIFGYGFDPEYEKTICARCGKTIEILHNMALVKKLDDWELDERSKRGLIINDWLDGDFFLADQYPDFLNYTQSRKED